MDMPASTSSPSRRRAQSHVDAQRFFDEMLFSPWHWPWKVVRLERDSLEEFRQRPLSAGVSIAELYHENSKLFPQALPEIAASRVDPGIRHEFVMRRTGELAAEATVTPVGQPLAELFAGVVARLETDVFYAIEFRVVLGSSLATYDPLEREFHLLKRLSSSDVELLRQAMRLMAPPGLPPHDGDFLFIVGFFGRNEMLLGPRGYRRTLLDAGRVAEVLLEEGRARGQASYPVYEFTDRHVEKAIELDGTEVGALVGFELIEMGAS